MKGYNVAVTLTHSDADLPVLSEEHYVTETDVDDVQPRTAALSFG